MSTEYKPRHALIDVRTRKDMNLTLQHVARKCCGRNFQFNTLTSNATHQPKASREHINTSNTRTMAPPQGGNCNAKCNHGTKVYEADNKLDEENHKENVKEEEHRHQYAKLNNNNKKKNNNNKNNNKHRAETTTTAKAKWTAAKETTTTSRTL
jgi:hypothetical protein